MVNRKLTGSPGSYCNPACLLFQNSSVVDWKLDIKSRNKLTTTMTNRAQELCESRGGRPGLPVPNSPYGPSVDVKQH